MRRALLVATCGLAFAAHAEEADRAWAFSAALYGYDVSESEDFVNPVVTADRGRLHLEARYNYEELDTASVWAGANFSAGETWAFEATAMLGGVFGEVEGVAPGYRLSLNRGWFELASEGEYYIDNHDHEENYFYTWTEVAGYPLEWLRFGLAVQRTRAYESELDVQRGIFAGATYKAFDAAFYAYNLDEDDPFYVLGLGFEF